jgi:hypothetical protein
MPGSPFFETRPKNERSELDETKQENLSPNTHSMQQWRQTK